MTEAGSQHESASGTATDPTSAAALFDSVYQRLKAMASRQLRANAGETLDTTALVHELYLRLNAQPALAFEHQPQFFAYAARAMRHLLCDRARHRQRQCAGGGWSRTTLDPASRALALESAEEALALDAALQQLAQVDARAAQTVELRYFAGLTLEQVASTQGLARRTVDRDWRFARAFLHDRLR